VIRGRLNVHVAAAAALTALLAQPLSAGLIVDYTEDGGGKNAGSHVGMAATASFDVSGNELVIVLTNASTAMPQSAKTADAYLVSLAFILPGDIQILSGDSAEIAVGSFGLGSWSDRGAGDSVAEEWMWTNGSGGDLLASYTQVISTSMGAKSGQVADFNGTIPASVNGPSGGIVAAPPLLTLAGDQPAVSNAIEFRLTLSEALTHQQLWDVADNSVVEFGSDFQYLTGIVIPAPAAAPLVAGALLLSRRRRRIP